MTLKILKTWVPSASEWDDAWYNCPYSTYFHSREWAQIWSEYTYGRVKPAPLGLAISDGTQIILPFSKEILFKGLVHRYISSPAGTFGGWLSKDFLDKYQQSLLMRFISKRYPNLIFRFNPYEKILIATDFFSIIKDETQSLDLSIGFEEIYRNWTKGHASATRKARKAGIEISLAENLEDWENYFLVYENSLMRWGAKTTSLYSWKLFQVIFRSASPNIRLWIAKHDGLVISGALCFYSPTHVVYWHGASLSSYFNLRPVNLLMYEIICDAINGGYKWFDFNPSGGHEGVKAFKKSFGTKELSCPVLACENDSSKLIFMSMRMLNRVKKIIRQYER